MAERVLILGGGQAGLQTAVSLRERGFAGAITLLGDEPFVPYQRPPLSKDYLVNGARFETLRLRPESFFAEAGIDLLTGRRAMEIDREGKNLRLEDGTALPYDRLVLATGTRNRGLPVPGANLAGVLSLKGAADADALRQALANAQRAVIIGAGFIGLEISAHCRSLGIETTIIEANNRAAARAVSPETSTLLLANQAAMGVEVIFGASVAGILGGAGGAAGVLLADGRRLAADVVLVCIGVLPNDDIAASAGLAVANGVIVNSRLRTTDPDIFAIGDCAIFHCVNYGGEVRLESVPNAIEQGKHVAAVITGDERDYAAMPWFWSDQGKLKLQMVGPTQIADTRVVVGDGAASTIFCFADERFIGVECINRPADFVKARRLLGAGASLSRQHLEAVGYDLKAAA